MVSSHSSKPMVDECGLSDPSPGNDGNYIRRRSCFPACGSGTSTRSLDLGYNPAEGEEEAEFINALESVTSDLRELYCLLSY